MHRLWTMQRSEMLWQRPYMQHPSRACCVSAGLLLCISAVQVTGVCWISIWRHHVALCLRQLTCCSPGLQLLLHKASDAHPLCADFPWLCCPRAALAKVLDLAQSKFGFTFRVGYESEFMLLHRLEPGSHPPFRPVDNSVYSQSSSFNAMAPGGAPYYVKGSLSAL